MLSKWQCLFIANDTPPTASRKGRRCMLQPKGVTDLAGTDKQIQQLRRLSAMCDRDRKRPLDRGKPVDDVVCHPSQKEYGAHVADFMGSGKPVPKKLLVDDPDNHEAFAPANYKQRMTARHRRDSMDEC